jgi:hypothetical protein
MRVIEMDAITYNLLRYAQPKKRTDCQAAFTAVGTEIWPFVHWGNTPANEREQFRGCSTVLDQIADELIMWRPDGGRFFIEQTGVYFRESELGPKYQFVRFPPFDLRLPLGMEKY